MKRITNLLILLSVVVLSCGEEQPLTKEKSFVDSFLESEAFVSLGIDIEDLDIENSSVTEVEAQKFSIMMPFKSNTLKFISGIAIKQDTYLIKVAYTFEYITSLNYDELTSALINKNYSDQLEWNVSDGTSISFKFEDGKLDLNETKLNRAGRMGCSSNVDRFSQQVANCAARRIDDMNWAEYTLCIIRIPACYAEQMLFCWVDGCPWI